MKKKKLKKIINKLNKKSERELDVEVNLLSDRINSLETSKRVLEEKMRLIDERTMALDTVKVQKTLDKTKELDSKIKILMDRTSVNYNTCSDKAKNLNDELNSMTSADIAQWCKEQDTRWEITYQECISLIYCMGDRGATKEELDGVKKLMNKYVFRCKLLLVDDEVPTPEEIIDSKKEA